MQDTRNEYKKRICRAMNFISRHIERDLTLEEIAGAASFSMYHFHRIFKAVAGETVAGFTRRLRLELGANRLISKPREDITSIALGCGFSSSQNFAKAFRKHFGTTPSEYRKSKNGNRNSKDEAALSLRRQYDSGMMFSQYLQSATIDPLEAAAGPLETGVEELPDYKVAYARALGAYTKENCEPAFRALMNWAIPRNYIGPGKVLAIYWDNPEVTPPGKCRFDACLVVPEEAKPVGQIFRQTISGGPYGVCRFERKPEEIRRAWDEAFEWLCLSGYETADRPCFERYHNSAAEHPEGKWIFDICIPLKTGF